MAANKVNYNGTTLIDLTSDTVTAETLLTGRTAHAADGTVITGTFLSGYPESFSVYGYLLDADGNKILDASGSPLLATMTYYRQ